MNNNIDLKKKHYQRNFILLKQNLDNYTIEFMKHSYFLQLIIM